MDKQMRLKCMVDILKTEKGASVKELSDSLNVTEMTIRRDIKQLTEDGIVKLISGAVILDENVAGSDNIYDLDEQRNKHKSEKHRIGKFAATLIEPNDVVFLDIGTTTTAIIPHISTANNITAVFCTLNALLEIHKKNIKDIIFLGGRYVPDLQVFESHEGVQLLNRTRISKAFISAAGVNAELGVTCVNGIEVDTKCAAINSALEKILVVDSTKFDLVKPAFFADLEQFNAIVTDKGITQEWKDLIEKLGIKLYVV